MLTADRATWLRNTVWTTELELFRTWHSNVRRFIRLAHSLKMSFGSRRSAGSDDTGTWNTWISGWQRTVGSCDFTFMRSVTFSKTIEWFLKKNIWTKKKLNNCAEQDGRFCFRFLSFFCNNVPTAAHSNRRFYGAKCKTMFMSIFNLYIRHIEFNSKLTVPNPTNLNHNDSIVSQWKSKTRKSKMQNFPQWLGWDGRIPANWAIWK